MLLLKCRGRRESAAFWLYIHVYDALSFKEINLRVSIAVKFYLNHIIKAVMHYKLMKGGISESL